MTKPKNILSEISRKGPARATEKWIESIAFLLATGQKRVAKSFLKKCYPEQWEVWKSLRQN